jgi:hypothetical protein
VGTCSECSKPVQARGLCPAHYARWRRNRPGRCRYCGGDLTKHPATNGRTHDRCLANRRANWHTLTDRVLAAYGARCSCCGETERVFLTIDHVAGDGRQHRASMGGGNRRLLLDIINRGFPPDFRVQCFNCNCGRERNGGVCPHELA